MRSPKVIDVQKSSVIAALRLPTTIYICLAFPQQFSRKNVYNESTKSN